MSNHDATTKKECIFTGFTSEHTCLVPSGKDDDRRRYNPSWLERSRKHLGGFCLFTLSTLSFCFLFPCFGIGHGRTGQGEKRKKKKKKKKKKRRVRGPRKNEKIMCGNCCCVFFCVSFFFFSFIFSVFD